MHNTHTHNRKPAIEPKEVDSVMDVMIAQTFEYMERTGCTLAEAKDRAATWLYVRYPHIAAAISLQTREVAA